MRNLLKAITCSLVLAAPAAWSTGPASAGVILFASTAGTLNTSSGGWTPIPGLSFTLPPLSPSKKVALITLNVPNPYARGNDYPGGNFGISVNGAVLVPTAVFTYSLQNPPNPGRCPTTLVVQVRLTANSQQIAAVWQSVRSSNVVMDTPSSLSAVIE